MGAVLAHELGHFKHKHIVKMMVTSWLTSLLGLALLGWLAQQVWFYTGLGVLPDMQGGNDALALVLFMLVVPLVTFFASPILSWRSRQQEFEADAYAASLTPSKDLASALLKLYQDNASTLTPIRCMCVFIIRTPRPVSAWRACRRTEAACPRNLLKLPPRQPCSRRWWWARSGGIA